MHCGEVSHLFGPGAARCEPHGSLSSRTTGANWGITASPLSVSLREKYLPEHLFLNYRCEIHAMYIDIANLYICIYRSVEVLDKNPEDKVSPVCLE